jgi:hypothetical protein
MHNELRSKQLGIFTFGDEDDHYACIIVECVREHEYIGWLIDTKPKVRPIMEEVVRDIFIRSDHQLLEIRTPKVTVQRDDYSSGYRIAHAWECAIHNVRQRILCTDSFWTTQMSAYREKARMKKLLEYLNLK